MKVLHEKTTCKNKEKQSKLSLTNFKVLKPTCMPEEQFQETFSSSYQHPVRINVVAPSF